MSLTNILAFTLCIAALSVLCTAEVNIVTNASLPLRNGEEKIPIHFNCTLNNDADFDDDQIVWLRNGKEINFDKEKSYKKNNKLGQLKITYVKTGRDTGNFTCRITISNESPEEKTIEIYGEPHVSFEETRSKNLVQGDPLILKCLVNGYPAADSITWLNPQEESLSSEMNNRVKLSAHEGVENATLKIEDMDFKDKGIYTCVASNKYGSHNATQTVRVKDKLAALWPFLGICGEVFILCAIIFLYERSRKKKNAKNAEVSDEAADKLTNSNEHQIRQRKT